MFKKYIFILSFMFLLTILPNQNASAQNIPLGCEVILPKDGETMEKYLICIPPDWSGELLLYAHGYVAFNQPVDGTSIPEVILSTGFGFATTSYSTNGLAIKEGVTEIVELANYFDGDSYPVPSLILLAGPSEGGLITVLAIEQYPDIFDGGLSTCGPIGDFRKQIDYWGDFRVVFDYFYPGLLRPSPVAIPSKVIDNWESKYAPRILGKIQEKPEKITQLINVTDAPFDPLDSNTILQTIERLLWYNVFATNDGVEKLGGQPFDNLDQIYSGSFNDDKLNRKAERHSAEPSALDNIEANYQTTGNIDVPLVTMHTTGDEVVPYWHTQIYHDKIVENANAPYLHIPVERYGHCNFTVVEVLTGFAWLYFNALGHHHEGILDILDSLDALHTYTEIVQQSILIP